MIVRIYEEKDYEEVASLVESSLPRSLPRRLGGVGVVVEEESRIVAFAWALCAPDSEIACVEFFVVAEDRRDRKIYGPLVITKLLEALKIIGVKEVIGLLVDGEAYTESTVRIYHGVGMTANRGYVVNGNIQTILEGIQARYGRKQ